MDKLKEYLEIKQHEVNDLMSQVESVMNEASGYLDQVYKVGGLEAFGDKLYSPEYYGVACIGIDGLSGDGTAYYYIPEGMEEFEGDEDYKGQWISSSQTCY